MTSPAATGTPPEAAGPGTYDPSGLVTYGDDAAPGPRAFVPPPVTAAERERNRAEAALHARCPRCMAIPDELAAALTAALTGKPVPR